MDTRAFEDHASARSIFGDLREKGDNRLADEPSERRSTKDGALEGTEETPRTSTVADLTKHFEQKQKPNLTSPVADCIRASFLADISSVEGDTYTTEPAMQSTSLIKTWSTPEKTTVSGKPPGPDVKVVPETARAEVRRQDVRVVTPMYKTDSSTVANGELRPGLSIHREAKIESRSLMDNPDYKVQREQEHYRLQIIDPKVESHANVPAHSHTLPSFVRKRNKTPDFPSAHSKRSFTKLDPLEQRRTRVKSVEIKQITPRDYLSESLERHRAISMSPLHDKLKVNERDVNQPWDKLAHPGPRPDEPRLKMENSGENHEKSIAGNDCIDQAKSSAEKIQKTILENRLKNEKEKPKRILRPSAFTVDRRFENASDDDYLHRLERQYFCARSLERRENAHNEIDSKLARTFSDTDLPCDFEDEKTESVPRAMRRDFFDDDIVDFRPIFPSGVYRGGSFLKPAIPPVKKKIMRRQSSLLMQQQQQQKGLRRNTIELPLWSGNRSHLAKNISTSLAAVGQPPSRQIFGFCDPILLRKLSEPTLARSTVSSDHVRKKSYALPPHGALQRKPTQDRLSATSSKPFEHRQLGTAVTRRANVENQQLQRSSATMEKRRQYDARTDVTTSSDAASSTTLSFAFRNGKNEHVGGLLSAPTPPVLVTLPPQALSPQKIVYENEPVAVPIDASYGPTMDFIVSNNVRQLKEIFQDKAVDRNWQQQQDYGSWDPYFSPQQQKSLAALSYPIRVSVSSPAAAYPHSVTPSCRQEIALVPPELAVAQKIIVDRSAQTNGDKVYVVEQRFPEHNRSQMSDTQSQSRKQDAIFASNGHYQNGTDHRQRDREEEVHFRNRSRQPHSTGHHDDRDDFQRQKLTRMYDESERRQREFESQRLRREQERDRSEQERLRAAETRHLKDMSRYVRDQQASEERHLRTVDEQLRNNEDVSEKSREPYSPDRERHSRAVSPGWRRVYFVDSPTDVVKNRIWRSREVLNEERYDIDMWARRETFIEKPESPPAIRRVGRVWQPPPETPYEFPRARQPYRGFEARSVGGEHKWEPYVNEPEFKYEKKNFTPENSPPTSRKSTLEKVTYNGHQTVINRQQRHRRRSAENGQRAHSSATDLTSPGDSSIAFSDQPSSSLPRSPGSRTAMRPSSDSPPALENEPTPRHPSTITVFEKPTVKIKDKIMNFEPAQKTTGKTRRGVGGNNSRQSSTGPQRSTSVDDDLIITSPHSSVDRRAVHFANGKPKAVPAAPTLHKIDPPPTITVKKELEDLAELAERRERLLDRAKHRSTINVHELRKVDVDVPPVPPRDRFKDTIDVRSGTTTGQSSFQYVTAQTIINEKALGELTRSQSLLNSEWEYGGIRQPKSRSQTNLATWQFSGSSFSPRSVVSINGHQDDGLLRIRTDLSPATRQIVHKSNASVQTNVAEQQQQQQPQFWPAVLVPLGATGTPTSTMTREFKEEKKSTREVERYSSLNDLDDNDSRQSTLIKIQDESARRPKSIMKSQQQRRNDDKQLIVKENWGTDDRSVSNGGGEVVRHIAPKVTETVSTVEETKRTEEVERRVRESQKKERKEKRSSKKKRSGESGGGGRHHHREHRHHRSSSSSNAWGPWLEPFDVDTTTSNGVGGLANEFKQDVASTSSRLTRESPNSAWRQQAITANGHGQSGGLNRYGQVTESYHRQTTTKRVVENANARHGSRKTDSVSPENRRQKNRRDAGVRWMNGNASSESRQQQQQQNGNRGHRSRMHKSNSSREVYHNELPEDYEETRARNGGPIIEYPPTLTRDAGPPPQRSHRNGGDVSVHKSRSYTDWDEHRPKDTSLMRKWEADMSGLERDFRDSLLMPMPPPGQNINTREHREENIPGGHESYSREVHANSGWKPGDGGSNTQYSESKQETSFRREQASDRRPY